MQAQYTIQGHISDKSGLDVPSAIVLSQSLPDSAILGTELTDSAGNFRLQADKLKNTLLKIIATSYKSAYVKPLDTAKIITLNIKLDDDSKELQSVVVNARKPIIERMPDRLVFNVENSISATGSDALSVLKKAPGVRVHDEDIALVGKSTVMVMINDKLLQLSGAELIEMLSSIPADNISKIEVITAPPAKYDAAGNSGIINIVTKRVLSDGLKGSATIGYLRRSLGAPFGDANVNYRKGKLNAYANISSAYFQSKPQAGYTLYYPEERWEQHNTQTAIYPYVRLQAGADYTIGKRSTIGFLYTLGASKPVTDDDIHTRMIRQNDNALDSVINTKAREVSTGVRNVFNVNYEYRIDSSGKKLNVDLDYFTRTGIRSRDFNTSNTFADGSSTGIASMDRTSGTQLVNIKSVKTDLTWPSKFAKFTLGGKASFIDNGSNNTFATNQGNVYVPDPNRSNEFDYTENTQALYTSAEKTFNKFGVQAGLRAEYTQAKGTSATLGIFNKYEYLKLFPSLFLQYSFNDDHALNFSYTRRIQRPDFMLLNPFRVYTNPTSYESGNPFLQPSYMTNLALGYTLKSKYTFELFVQRESNIFSQVLKVDTAIAGFNFTNDNIGNAIGYGFSAGAVLNPFPWWECSLQLYGYYTQFSSSYYSALSAKNYSRPSCNISTNNTIFLNAAHTLVAALDIDYQANELLQFDLQYSTFNMGAGIRALLLKKRITIGLNAEDIFATDRYRLRNLYNGSRTNSYGDERCVRLSFNYKFGSRADMKRRENTSGIEERQGLNNRSGNN